MFINIPGDSDSVLVFSGTGTGPGTTTFTHNQGVEANYPGELYPAVFIFAITDIVGSFSGLQVNLEWSPITPDMGTPQFQTVGTWTPLTSPVSYFACSASGIYRLNCTMFSGGTSFNVYVSIASTMPQSTGGGGGGSVTQGTVPWVVSFIAPQHVIVDSGSIAVSGSVSISGDVNVTQGTNPWVISFTAPQHVVVDSGSLSVTQGTSPWVISGSISFTAPQHVIVDSGTVTANQGTPNSLANAWPTELTDGTNGPATVATLTHSNALAVEIVDGSGNQIISFGGGTQYASGTAVATPTGTQVIAWDGATVWAVSAAHLTNSNALAVEIVDSLGNQITSFGGGTQYADNATSGATPTGTLSMGWDYVNAVVRAQRVDANQNLLVSLSPTSSVVDLLQTLILETRAMRTALVYMVTENQDVLTSDFDPGNQDFQPVN